MDNKRLITYSSVKKGDRLYLYVVLNELSRLLKKNTTDCVCLYYYNKFSNYVLFGQLNTNRNNIDSIKCQMVSEILEPNFPLCAKLLIREYTFTIILQK